jgi:hypothetical protein
VGTSSTSLALPLDEYMKWLEVDYLDDYVAEGGGAVKFVSLDGDEVAGRFSPSLQEAALSRDYLHVAIDAAATPVQFIEEFFFAVAHEIDWFGLAAAFVRGCYEELGMSLGALRSPDAVSVRAVARANDVHDGELHRSMRRIVEKKVFSDGGLSPEFRIAMLRTCQAVLAWGDVNDTEKGMLLHWLHGDTVALPKLRSLGLYRRIARHQARYTFASLCHWIRCCGYRGLVVDVDVSRFAVVRRPPVEARRGFYYSRAAVLDTYEALRQFVDSTAELEGVLMVVSAPRRLMADPHRGPGGYQALHQRIYSEVDDSRRVNPLASLVRTTI